LKGFSGDDEIDNVVSWVRYVDNIGYVSFEEFLEIPCILPEYVSVIRRVQELSKLKAQLGSNPNKDTKRMLIKQINILEDFFR